jgi:hypothetical protein
MFSRNSSRDAEQAQNQADSEQGAPSNTHPRDLQDESGHVSYRRGASASGTHHTDADFTATMADVVGGLYEETEQEGEEQPGDDERVQENSFLLITCPRRWQSNGRRREGSIRASGGQVGRYSRTLSFSAPIYNQRQPRQEQIPQT